MLIICTLLYLLLAANDMVPMVKSKQWKVFVLYSALILFAYVLTVLQDSGVKLPSPSDPIKQLVISIVGDQ